MKNKIKKKDKVRVMTGKDKGREAVVEKVYTKNQTVILPGINIYKKHIKKNEKLPKGGIVEIPRPINVAKLILICSKCNQPTRVGWQLNKNKKVRICKKCNGII